MQEGTIGPDLVVKPVPASVRQHLDSGRRRNADDDDDEAFLDEEAAEDVAVKSGFPLPLALSRHIVYKRSTPLPDPDMSDFGQYLHSSHASLTPKTNKSTNTFLLK